MAIDQDMQGYIRYLYWKEGHSIREIYRKTGVNRKTIGKIVTQEKREARRERRSKLELYKSEIAKTLMLKPGLSTILLLEHLRKKGYDGGKTIVYDYVSSLKTSQKEAFVPLEHLPGDQAQVDWGECGTISCGEFSRKYYVFSMTLCYSRYLYIEFTISMDTDTFLACHVHAFHYFRGVPQKMVYDNLKSAVISRSGKEIRFNGRLLDFARYYGFKPVACNVRAPHEKGKVENSIGYIKHNFLPRGPFANFNTICFEGKKWLNEIANVRIHGTIKKRPQEVFINEEKALLTPLPSGQYDTAAPRHMPVSKTCLVNFQTNKYSVPSEYAYKMVVLKARINKIDILFNHELIASHRRCYDKFQLIKNPKHYEALLRKKRKAATTINIEQFNRLSDQSKTFLDGLVKHQKNVHYHINKILELVSLFGRTAVCAGIDEALSCQSFHWDFIQNYVLESMPGQPPLALPKKTRQDLMNMDLKPLDLSKYDRERSNEK